MIYLALGANLPSRYGSPEETLRASLSALEASGIQLIKCSSIWLSAPVPVSDQPWYRNAVIAVRTSLDIPELLKALKDIEHDFGRESAARNAPRVLDLDIIAYNGQVYEDDSVTVPHPRMDSRAFVLRPLEEISSDWIHPVSEKTVQALIDELPEGQEIERLVEDIPGKAV